MSIDAYVIELVVDIPLSPNLAVCNLAQKAEQSDFLEWTGLALLRPESLPEISTPSGYLDLIAHINRKRRRLGLG